MGIASLFSSSGDSLTWSSEISPPSSLSSHWLVTTMPAPHFPWLWGAHLQLTHLQHNRYKFLSSYPGTVKKSHLGLLLGNNIFLKYEVCWLSLPHRHMDPESVQDSFPLIQGMPSVQSYTSMVVMPSLEIHAMTTWPCLWFQAV